MCHGNHFPLYVHCRSKKGWTERVDLKKRRIMRVNAIVRVTHDQLEQPTSDLTTLRLSSFTLGQRMMKREAGAMFELRSRSYGPEEVKRLVGENRG